MPVTQSDVAPAPADARVALGQTQAELDFDREQTLLFCRQVAAEVATKMNRSVRPIERLQPGRPGIPCGCAVATTLQASTGLQATVCPQDVTVGRVDGAYLSFTPWEAVRRFIRAFDVSCHPDLERPGAGVVLSN